MLVQYGFAKSPIKMEFKDWMDNGNGVPSSQLKLKSPN